MRSLPIAVLVVLVPACASVPSRFSVGSAAAPEAAAAPVADVTVALRDDPPLPGADATGWPGLGGEVPAMDHSHHHTGHGGEGMPMDHGAMGGMPMDHGAMGDGSTPMDHSGMSDPPPPPPPAAPEEEEEHPEGGHHGH